MREPPLAITAETVKTRRDNGSVASYSAELQELAFELWFLQCYRNAEATARALAASFPGETDTPDARTIRYWVKNQQWDIEADNRIDTFAPAMRRRNIRRVFALEAQAIDVYGETIEGNFSDPKKQAIKLQGANAVASVTGLMRRDAAHTPTPIASDEESDAASSPADTAEKIRRILDRYR